MLSKQEELSSPEPEDSAGGGKARETWPTLRICIKPRDSQKGAETRQRDIALGVVLSDSVCLVQSVNEVCVCLSLFKAHGLIGTVTWSPKN